MQLHLHLVELTASVVDTGAECTYRAKGRFLCRKEYFSLFPKAAWH